MRKTIAILLPLFTLAGCKTLDSALNTADKAFSVVESGTVRTLRDAADSDDAGEFMKQKLKDRREDYKDNPHLLTQDIRQVQSDFNRLMDLLQINVNKNWGSDSRLPDRVHYVKYTQNYQSRAIVDFDRGSVTVETLETDKPNRALKNAIVTTLLTPDDPRAVDLFSDKEIELTSKHDPYLLKLVVDHNNQPVRTPQQAEAFAAHLIAAGTKQRSVEVKDGTRQARYVTIPMVSNFSSAQAEKYRPLVEKYAARYKISPSLVYAMIRTESNFNPFAVSHAPAYGLMQLVPTSGGREAYRKVKGQDGIPSKDYLFDAENNIELGVAYLNVLNTEQLHMVQNRIAREYCVISAYNTGPGNVLKAFSRDRVEAVNAINSLQPPQVYERLRAHLPYEETRHYLAKVVGYRRDYVVLSD
ncbi:murein transglycosylase domain-containing protein [Sulfurivermis fontis]|uniref:murein transglycosylase domain-containing protein n=1 Tax=Sulfurivermis fontis TaxID=1972068 RepID=UPI000FD6F4B9|nr:murein transglycosylase domain-containing protein [Sulfurivermis fontis]